MRFAKFIVTLIAAVAVAAPCFADTVTGLWRGEYTCGQGVTAVTLAMREDSRGRVDAAFVFGAHPKNPGVPSGCFTLSGRRKVGALALKSQRWIRQPDPFWYMIDLGGRISPDGARYQGAIPTPPEGFCTTFDLVRISRAAPPSGAAACDGADLVS